MPAHRRRGQALVEFAVIAFVLTLLLSATLAFGLLLFGANVVQQAADVAAQELARHPFDPVGSFDDALADSGLFLESALVVPVGTDPATLPLVNRLLSSVYVYDPDIGQLRYPGTVVENADGDLTVLIPVVGSRDADGVETIAEWRPVVEQVGSPYAMDSVDANLAPGTVALRVNYPYQAAALVAYRYTDGSGNPVAPGDVLGQDVQNIPVTANDAAVAPAPLPDGYSFVVAAGDGIGPHSGRYGLGRQLAWAKSVRPFRQLVTAQGVYRREVFDAATP